jgi:Uma2 family endonuclease
MATAELRKPRRQRKSKSAFLDAYSEEATRGSFFMPAGSMSLSEFRQWTYSDKFPKTGLIAYIGKEIFVDMSPERIVSHGSVKTAICRVIMNLTNRKPRGKFYMDRTRFAHPSAEVSNEPDAFFALMDTLKNGTLRMIPTADGEDFIEMEGTPDWILEIVSPSSVKKDKKDLRERYHKACVGEYWLVDARGEDVDFQILLRGEEDYQPARQMGSWQVSRIFGKRFRLRRITDELGGVDYRLEMK